VARALSGRQSVVEHVEECLRGMIVSGQMKPGERIVETRVARQLGISQPAVREALKTLEAEGLVARQVNRGCSVITLSAASIDQIFALRVELEVLAVKLVMDRGAAKKDGLGVLFDNLAKMKAAARQGDAAQYYRHDLEFHRAWWHLAGNPYLERALSQTIVPLFAFVMIEVSSRADFDLVKDAKQHERILQAIASGDKRHAVSVTRDALMGFCKHAVSVSEQVA
jgi:DNA-binding GntR family transcriptional regulator